MRHTFSVAVETEREDGKFASRDEIGGLIEEALGEANPETIDTEEGSYSVTDWDVTEDTPKPGKPRETTIVFASARHVADLLYRMEGCTARITVKVGKIETTLSGTIGGVAMRGGTKGVTFLPANEPGQRVFNFGEVRKVAIHA
jgi:hypothetical protein